MVTVTKTEIGITISDGNQKIHLEDAVAARLVLILRNTGTYGLGTSTIINPMAKSPTGVFFEDEHAYVWRRTDGSYAEVEIARSAVEIKKIEAAVPSGTVPA